MCGRFALIHGHVEVADFLAAEGVEAFPARYNIAPTQPVLVVIAGPRHVPGRSRPARTALLVRWGLIPGWAKNLSALPLLFNARSETATAKAAFKAAMRHRRALMPASGFFEWRRAGGGTVQPFWVRPKNGRPMAFAALMETYAEPGGAEIDTASILTTRASVDTEHIHARMPVVIKPEHFSRWLDCVNHEPRDLADLLEPVESGFFEAIPVSDKVNNTANLGPELLERVDPAHSARPGNKRGEQMSLF